MNLNESEDQYTTRFERRESEKRCNYIVISNNKRNEFLKKKNCSTKRINNHSHWVTWNINLKIFMQCFWQFTIKSNPFLLPLFLSSFLIFHTIYFSHVISTSQLRIPPQLLHTSTDPTIPTSYSIHSCIHAFIHASMYVCMHEYLYVCI